MLVEKFRNHRGVASIRQHSDLHCSDCDVIHQFLKLRSQLRSRRRVHGLNTLRGLHGESRNRGHSIAVVRRKRLQVGGHTCAARRIESGNREKNWGSVVQMTIQSQCPPREAQKPVRSIFRAGRQRKMYAYCGTTRKSKLQPRIV
jgi:hypothetical protein